MATKATRLHLRRVDDSGSVGEPLGTATLSGKTINYEGSPILGGVLGAIAQRFHTDEPGAFALLAADGWSNGSMVITADTETDAPGGQEEGTMSARVDLNRLHNLATAARERMVAAAGGPARVQRDPLNRSWYRIENRAATADAPPIAEIYLYDTIGDWGVSAQDFVTDLSGVTAAAIDLHVNCEGGEVFDGLAIYETLRRHPADITAHVDGIAASAASFVVQAASKIVMAKRGRMMIHDAHGIVMGNARDMREMATLLDELSDTIADIYAERSGGTRAQWRTAMSAAEGGPDGTWYDAEAAVRAGLADEVQGTAPAGRAPARAELTAPDGAADAPAGRDPQWAPVAATWDPSAFLVAIGEVENPPEPVHIPSGDELLSLFKDLP